MLALWEARMQSEELSTLQGIPAQRNVKLPSDYEGAYEKHLKQSASRVAAVTGAGGAPSPQMAPAAQTPEHPETFVARTGGQSWAITSGGPPAIAPPQPEDPVKLTSQWLAFHDDESEVVKALQEVSPELLANVSMPKENKQEIHYSTPHVKYPIGISSKHPPPLTRAQIAAVARDVKSGKLELPDVDLPTNADYVSLWALMDSGSSFHAINVEKHVPGAKNYTPFVLEPWFQSREWKHHGKQRYCTIFRLDCRGKQTGHHLE